MENILEKSETGKITLRHEVIERYRHLQNLKQEILDEESSLRSMILESMVENHLDKCECDEFSFTQIIPKPTILFDTNNFILNESEDVVKCFTTFDETETFDKETFKNDNPELYDKYVKKTTTINVDTNKLQKSLTNVYDKYTTIIASDKPSTLRVNLKKGQ